SAEYLRDNVGCEFLTRKAAACPQSEAHGGIDVASGDVPYSIRHRQQRESEGQRHAGEADSEMGKAGGQYRAAASAQHQPERPDEFRSSALREAHSHSRFSCDPISGEPSCLAELCLSGIFIGM